MNFTEYQNLALSTAIYPKKYETIYPALGLCGEAGEVAEKIPYNEQKIILAEIPIRDLASFYMRFGELFAIICSLISIILLGAGWVKNRS